MSRVSRASEPRVSVSLRGVIRAARAGMESRQQDGLAAEALAAAYLRLLGFEVLAQNVVLAGVQVDLVAREGRRLLLVEVKLRGGSAAFAASQSLRPRQLQRLRRAAAATLSRCVWARSVRVDLVGITWRPGNDVLRLEHCTGVG